jgi:large subunit ribosomal protein L25
MSEAIVLSASVRERVGKGSARQARREGRVPAVIYGDKKDPLSITLESRMLVKLMNQPGFFTNVYDIEVGGAKHRTLARDIQLHPVTDMPEHIDFLRVSATTRVTVAVPVTFTNEDASPGLGRGGVLNVVRHEVEVNTTPDKIPSELVADLSGLDIGDSLHISAISLPEGVEPAIADRDFTIATIASPTLVRDEAAEEQDVAEDESEDEDETEA